MTHWFLRRTDPPLRINRIAAFYFTQMIFPGMVGVADSDPSQVLAWVVPAPTAEDARIIVAADAGSEGANVWLDPSQSACDDLYAPRGGRP